MFSQRNRPSAVGPLSGVLQCASGHPHIGRRGDRRHAAETVDLRHTAVAEISQHILHRVGRIQKTSENQQRLGRVPAVSRGRHLHAELDAVSAHTHHDGGEGYFLRRRRHALRRGHQHMQEEPVVDRQFRDNLIPAGRADLRELGDQLQIQEHAGGKQAVVVLIAHSGGLRQNLDNINSSGIPDRLIQRHAVVISEPPKMRLDLLVVKSPPEHFGRIPRMNRRIAHPAVDGILAHDDRHAGGCGHGRGASAVVVLSGIDDDLSRLHLLPCLPGRLRQSVVDRRAADCCAHRNCDVLDRDGRPRHQDFVLLHPRNHIDCRGYFRPDRTGLHKNLRHSLVGFLNLCSDIHVFPFLPFLSAFSKQIFRSGTHPGGALFLQPVPLIKHRFPRKKKTAGLTCFPPNRQS